jgi:F-type H+-transporting ATPase subunit delta|tara:strand:+ start:458 stop:991 length:534 start_codon:yes stop_codon:yes gene_type:complete
MSEFRVSSKYASSLLQVAVKKNILDDIYKDIKLLGSLCKDNNFLLMLRNPFISYYKKKKILHNIFKGKVNDLMLSFFNLLVLRGREVFIPSIVETFLVKYNEHCNIKNAKITTTFNLSKNLRSDFINLVKKITLCNKVNLIESVDASLIGGYILSVDDKKIDESIKSNLNLLRLSFK